MIQCLNVLYQHLNKTVTLKNAFADLLGSYLVDTLYWFMHILKIIYMFQTLAEVSFINQDGQQEVNLHKEKHKMIIITCIK